MINIDYLGLKCGVCGKDFKEDDDVVVCPDCGTPSHRACYKDNSGCPNAYKHDSDFVFEGFDKIKKSAQGVKEDKPKPNTDSIDNLDYQNNNNVSNSSNVSVKREITCPYCGELNKPEANFCNRCGAKFVKIQPIPVMNTDGNVGSNNQTNPFNVPTPPQAVSYAPDPLSGVPANTVFEEDVTAADLACFVSVNTPYYLRVFDLLKRKVKKFNFSAFVFSGIWFLYRKLYKIGSLIFSIEILLYALRYYIIQTYSTDIMKNLLAGIGLTIDQRANLSWSQYVDLSEALQKLPAAQQALFMLPSILFILQIVIMIICGVIANKTYYSHCVKRIQSIKKLAKDENLDSNQTSQALYLGGGVNPFVAGVFSLIYLILFL